MKELDGWSFTALIFSNFSATNLSKLFILLLVLCCNSFIVNAKVQKTERKKIFCNDFFRVLFVVLLSDG